MTSYIMSLSVNNRLLKMCELIFAWDSDSNPQEHSNILGNNLSAVFGKKVSLDDPIQAVHHNNDNKLL